MGGDHVVGGQAVGEQGDTPAIGVHVRQGADEIVTGNEIARLDQNFAQRAAAQQPRQLVAHQPLGHALGFVRGVEQQRRRRGDLACIRIAHDFLKARRVLLMAVGKIAQVLAPVVQLVPQMLRVFPGAAFQRAQVHGDVAVPVTVEGVQGFRDDRAPGIQVQVTEVGVRVHAKVMVGDVAPADDGVLAVGDPGLVVHPVVQAGGVIQPLQEVFVTPPERVEQAHFHIGVGIERRPFHVPTQLVGMVQQQPHAHPAPGRFQGPVHQQLADMVVVPDVVLQIQGFLRQPGGGGAQGEGFLAVRQQAESGLAYPRGRRGGVVAPPVPVAAHTLGLRLSRISRSRIMSSGTWGVGGVSTGAACSSRRLMRLMPRTSRKVAQATIRKLITLLMNRP